MPKHLPQCWNVAADRPPPLHKNAMALCHLRAIATVPRMSLGEGITVDKVMPVVSRQRCRLFSRRIIIHPPSPLCLFTTGWYSALTTGHLVYAIHFAWTSPSSTSHPFGVHWYYPRLQNTLSFDRVGSNVGLVWDWSSAPHTLLFPVPTNWMMHWWLERTVVACATGEAVTVNSTIIQSTACHRLRRRSPPLLMITTITTTA